MRPGTGYVVALLIASLAQATEPATSPATVAKPAAAAAKPVAKPAAKPVAVPVLPPTPLKLTVGNVRKYMMPNQYQAEITASDNDAIIVEGERSAPPLKSTQPQPTGLGAVYSLFAHPGSAWRLFLPDPNGVAQGPPDPVPPHQYFPSQ